MRGSPNFTAYLALVCVCFFWGTTYLGIRIAVEDLPPAVLMCVRYLLSGGVMLTVAKLGGARFPQGRELWATAGYGVLTIALGTGALTYAEVWVPSGLASLFVTTASFWLVAAEAAMPGGEPLHGPTIGAMTIGAAGTTLLVTAPSAFASGSTSGSTSETTPIVAGFVLIQIGYVGWALGSILQRRQNSKAHPIVSAAVQQFAAGAAFVVPALWQAHSAHWTPRSMGATLYLAVFGGMIGYSAYAITMTRLPVAIASIYSYINPLVAVLLGVWIYGEQFTAREGIAMGIIFVGVALVKRAQRGRVAN